MRLLLLAVGIAVGAIVVASNTVDEGEVVTLVTQNGSGASYDTQLWIVDYDGHLYLRAGSPRVHWLARLREHPEVVLKRGNEKLLFTARPEDDGALRAVVNTRMAEKYGFADTLWGYLGDRAHAIPILLEPRTAP